MNAINEGIKSFSLNISKENIEILQKKLINTRLPDKDREHKWATGVDLCWFKHLLDYWINHYDWRKSESSLNSFSQFKTCIGDDDIHFIHHLGKGPKNIPLLLMHGWPGSIFEFLDIIPILTDPNKYGIKSDYSFSVVAPSLPGFTLSFRPHQKRYGVEEISECFYELMVKKLNYKQFCLQGGDWGAFIGSRMAYEYKENIMGLHLNMLALRRDFSDSDLISKEETKYLSEIKKWRKEETGYLAIQASRPQTLAYALTDSPAGLAAWIAEKFYAWTDCDGLPENSISLDKIIANICLYWFTGAIGSSFWPYYARNQRSWPIPEGKKISIPVGYSEFPKEILKPPKSLTKNMYSNLLHWSVMQKGGHFAAMEEPEALAKDVFSFFSKLKFLG